MSSIAEVLSTGGHEEIGVRSPQVLPRDRGVIYRKISVAGLVLVIPITIIFATEMGWAMCSFYIVVLVGEVRARETYQLNVKVDPDINTFLLLEKARTGMSIPQLVEHIFREYSNLNRQK